MKVRRVVTRGTRRIVHYQLIGAVRTACGSPVLREAGPMDGNRYLCKRCERFVG